MALEIKVSEIEKGCREVPSEPRRLCQSPDVDATAVSQVVVDGISSLGLAQVRPKTLNYVRLCGQSSGDDLRVRETRRSCLQDFQ
jgi:hypothetical protein